MNELFSDSSNEPFLVGNNHRHEYPPFEFRGDRKYRIKGEYCSVLPVSIPIDITRCDDNSENEVARLLFISPYSTYLRSPNANHFPWKLH